MTTSTTEVYVAFSIHGTNCFITANKHVEIDKSKNTYDIDGIKFSREASRTSSLRGATKLITDELCFAPTTHWKRPLTSPNDVYEFFSKLKSLGWQVDDTNFVKRHKINTVLPSNDSDILSTPDSISVAPQIAEATSVDAEFFPVVEAEQEAKENTQQTPETNEPVVETHLLSPLLNAASTEEKPLSWVNQNVLSKLGSIQLDVLRQLEKDMTFGVTEISSVSLAQKIAVKHHHLVDALKRLAKRGLITIDMVYQTINNRPSTATVLVTKINRLS